MANVKISQLPSGTPTVDSVIVGDNAAGTVTEKYTLGDITALAVNAVVDTAPAALNTLNELAAALNDDENFASTVTNALATKSDVGHTHTLAELNGWLSQPGSREIFVNNSRTDSYTEDGSVYRPFKTMRSALASISDAVDRVEFNDVTKRYYCFRIAPGFYDEEAGGNLNIPQRPNIAFDLTGGVTLKGNYVLSRSANLLTTQFNVSNVAITSGSNTITVSTSNPVYSRLRVGAVLTGTGITAVAPNTTTVITAINGSTITLNNNATATNANATVTVDAGDLSNSVFAMIGNNDRPGFNNAAHSYVGILGNLTVTTSGSTPSSGGFTQIHLTRCGVRGVIEVTGSWSYSVQLFCVDNATFDTLKTSGTVNPQVTLYARDIVNSQSNGLGNIIGNVLIVTLASVVFTSWASVFPTGVQALSNLENTWLPGYNEIKANSFTRTNNVATVTLALNHGQGRDLLPDGYWREQYILVNGVTEDTSFNTSTSGAKVVAYPAANQVSYESTGPDVSVAVTAANSKWIKGTFFGNASASGFSQPSPTAMQINEAALHTHPGWSTNTQPGLGSAFIMGRSSALTFRYPAVGWAASAQYVRNRILLPGNGYQYRNLTSTGVGRSGTTQPTWPTTIGATVTDGAVTWSCEQLTFPLAYNLGFTGSITSGSNQVTVANGSVLAANFQVGQTITGTGIPSSTTITAISGSTLTLSANATATNASATLTVAGNASSIGYNVQQTLELLHDSKNIYHNQIDSGIAGATTVQQAFKSTKALLDTKPTLVSVPATAASTGTAGQIAYDSGFIYVCVAANTWVRAALSTW